MDFNQSPPYARAARTSIVGRPRRLARRLQEALHAPQHGLGVALCLFDLDDFKTINDNLGHAAGDRLLHAVAQAVAAITPQ